LSPANVSFGNVYLGLPSFQAVTLTNTGNALLTVTRVTVSSGNDSDDFKAFPLCPSNLAAGKSCQIIVTFVTDGDNYNPTGTLGVIDDALGSPQSVPLSAVVINPKASLSSYSLNFGKQKVGTTSAAHTVTLTNTGTTCTRPVNPFRSFPRESHGLYSVTSKYNMDCGILIRGDDDIGG